MPQGSVREMAAQIAALQVPAILLDTCILIDLVQEPVRAKKSETAAQVLKAAAVLAADIASPVPSVAVVIAELVHDEFGRLINDKAAAVEKAFADHDLAADVLFTCVESLEGSMPRPLRVAPYAQSFRHLAERIVRHAWHLDRFDELDGLAHRRNRERRPPGCFKSQSSDCEITEHYLSFAHALQVEGATHPVVFLTSNTVDYCQSKTRVLDPALQAEFAQAGLSFNTHLPGALSQCNLLNLLRQA